MQLSWIINNNIRKRLSLGCRRLLLLVTYISTNTAYSFISFDKNGCENNYVLYGVEGSTSFCLFHTKTQSYYTLLLYKDLVSNEKDETEIKPRLYIPYEAK